MFKTKFELQCSSNQKKDKTMTANAVVRARIDERIKEEAATVLAAVGLTPSSAFRIMMTRIAKEKALPFDTLIPNKATIAAMKEARKGKLKSFAGVDALMADLNEND
jgi:DNA-damage-inducible protein J